MRAHGVVVDSVNVSVLLYEPVRSASLAPMCCRKSSDTASLEIGPVQVSRFSGLAEEPTLLNAVPVLAALRARAVSAIGQAERAVDQVAGRRARRIGDAQQRVARGRDHVRGRRGVVVLSTPGVNAPKLRRRAQRQAQRRRHRAAGGAVRRPACR